MSKLLHDDHPLLEKMRDLLTRLPEAAEVEAWGHPTFRAGKKMFGGFGEREGHPVFTLKQTPEQQAGWLKKRGYFLPPYVGMKGWIGVWGHRVAWSTIEKIAVDAYRQTANKRMLKALDGE